MYSTLLSTFTSVDPINQAAADTQAGNGYMYARGNPLKSLILLATVSSVTSGTL